MTKPYLTDEELNLLEGRAVSVLKPNRQLAIEAIPTLITELRELRKVPAKVKHAVQIAELYEELEKLREEVKRLRTTWHPPKDTMAGVPIPTVVVSSNPNGRLEDK